ncbi:hypothetical protein EZS27_039128, partial [termite gut metagenome]
MYALQLGLPKEHVAPGLANLGEIRVHLFASAAWRSFWIITIGTVLLLLHNIRKLKTVWMITAIAALCLFDMWT